MLQKVFENKNFSMYNLNTIIISNNWYGFL